MALILVIMGFIVTTLMPRIIGGIKRDMTAEIKRAVRSARSEVLGYAKDHGCTLPSSGWFQATAAHRLGRLGEGLFYRSSATSLILVTGVTQPVAFFIASNGTDQTNDTDYTANPVDLRSIEDDIVDFATAQYVESLCP